jgi:single-strand DNA-binding protein
MASLNKVFLLGNLTRDPDLRALPSGSAVCEFGIAVNRRYTAANGQDVEEPCFVDIVVWGRSAESCKQYLEKGSQVMIEGRLQLDQWEDRNGGGKRSRLRVVAEQVQFLNRRPGGDGQGYGDSQGYGGGHPQGGGYNNQQGGYNQPPPQQQPQQPPQRGNYGNPPPQGGGMPRTAPPPQQGGMPRAPQQPPMPPMPPDGAFNPDDGAEDDIPF